MKFFFFRFNISQYFILSTQLFNKISYFAFKTHFRLPWDQNTLTGYMAEIYIFSLGVGTTFAISTGSALMLFISICIHHGAFSKMFKHTAQKLGQQNTGNSEILRELVNFHNSVKG